MIKSKKLTKFKNINHAFFNSFGGISTGIYKSLNCGRGTLDSKKNISRNLNIVSKKIGCVKKNLIFDLINKSLPLFLKIILETLPVKLIIPLNINLKFIIK